MAENISIYAGLEKVGKLRKRAVEREAARERKDESVSELFWDMLRRYGSAQLKKDLEAAEKAVAK